MKIALIGCGIIGQERLSALQTISQKFNQDITVEIYDTNHYLSEEIAQKYRGLVSATHYTLPSLLKQSFDWIFIAVPHHVAPDIIKQALATGSNVLAEKPLGRSLAECEDIIKCKPENSKLHIGFNYRFYDGISNAIKDFHNGKFGKLISVNMVLAHGNAPNTLNGWKLDPVKDGGVLIDLGVHLIDLALQLSKGGLGVDKSVLWEGFWNTGIEDEEAHVILSDDDFTIFNLQVSENRWRSTFRLELNGTEGYGVVEGRGRSFGPQTYRTGERHGWHKANKNQVDTEIVRECDTKTSFIEETLAVLKIEETSKAVMKPNETSIIPCDHNGVVKVMQLLEQCK